MWFYCLRAGGKKKKKRKHRFQLKPNEHIVKTVFLYDVGDYVDGNLAVLKLVTCVLYEMWNDCRNVASGNKVVNVGMTLIAAFSFYDLIVVVEIIMVAKILKW